MILASSDPTSVVYDWIGHHLSPNQFLILAAVGCGLYALIKVVEGSEKLAKFVPLIGRKMRQRAEEKIEARKEFTRDQVKEVIAELEPPNYAEKVDKLEQRIDVLEQKDDVAHAWHVYDEAWHRDDELERTENDLPIKPRLTFRDFAAKWYSGFRWRNGTWLDSKDDN